jgi:poly [ADP-ribose] polymerase
MPNPKAWKLTDPGAPSFPAEFEILDRATLQKTDIGNNNNKFYGLELHKANGKLRVFTHYGRTGDLASNPNAGTKECRYFDTLAAAQAEYTRIYKAKTGKRKGYVELSLASSNIGSDKARGTSSGHVDAKTTEKIEAKTKLPAAPKPVNVCPPSIRNLIALIYNEATHALTNTVQAKITAKGIETPLGVLTIGQIEHGELFLKEIFDAVQAGDKGSLEGLSSQFYTAIPHKLGRTRARVQQAIIDSKAKISEKEETLQLMRDMLKVDGKDHSVLVSDDVGDKYKALGCSVENLAGTPEFEKWRKFTLNSRIRSHRGMSIKSVYRVTRPGEKEVFKEEVGNIKMLFHGSRIKNWVGLLTRGVLMPKLVTAMGINRTDGGWLGNGIYFGDAACTSVYYTSPGRGGHRIMSVNAVALGKMKDYRKITYGLNAPPAGYNSCHGVRGTEFSDTELVIYDMKQQMMQYLVEFTA